MSEMETRELASRLIVDVEPDERMASFAQATKRQDGPPTALVVDCGTGETKVILYSYEDDCVHARVLDRLESASKVLDAPETFIERVRSFTRRTAADVVLISASAWMRYAERSTLEKGNVLLQALTDEGVLCKILEEREEAWFELASIEFALERLSIDVDATWASGGGSTQFSSSFDAVYTIPIGNERGRSLLISFGRAGVEAWQRAIRDELSAESFRVGGSVLGMSAAYYAATSAGLPTKQPLSKSAVKAAFETYIEGASDKADFSSEEVRDLSNVILQNELLSFFVADDSTIQFYRNFVFGGSKFSITWSSGWYLFFLNESRHLSGRSRAIVHLAEENKLYEAIASAVLDDEPFGFSRSAAGHLVASIGETADWLLAVAEEHEPAITALVAQLCEDYHCELFGLDHRIKRKFSLRQKLMRRLSVMLQRHHLQALYLPRVSEVIAGVDDVIRYTIIIERADYVSTIMCIVQHLKARLSARVDLFNFWNERTTFCSVNAYVQSSPINFEIQFHTHQSIEVKKSASHGIYAGFRDLSPSKAKLILYRNLMDIWRKVATPPGLSKLGDSRPMVDPLMEEMDLIDHLSDGRDDLDAFSALCYRLVRGRQAGEFDYLAYPPAEKRLAWVSASTSISEVFAELVGDEPTPIELIARTMGKPEAWVASKVRSGYAWKLIVMPRSMCQLADWPGCLSMVQRAYPEVASKIARYRFKLMTTPFEDIEASLEGATFRSIKDTKRESGFYIDLERLRSLREPTLWQVRGFLYNTIGVNELFSGDGLRTEPGSGIIEEEYLTFNRRLDEVHGVRIFDLTVGA